MSVTDGDRERARQAVFPGYVADRIELVAAALAEEREKAQAPFLELADRFSELAQELGWARGEHYADAADAISRAAEAV